MIISHRHRFIFIKTQKTAGTSIEVFLSGLCGPEDVVTPFGVPEPGHEPRNFAGYTNHMTASEIRSRVGEDLWRAYFTFCFERNPWDKTVSHFWFQRGKGQVPEDWNFQRYLQSGRLPHNFAHYTEKGAPIVDVIGKYESLQSDLQDICRYLGISNRVALPRAKSAYREDDRLYTAYYNEAEADFVRHAFAREIELHGYTFGPE